jgi:beta-mannosidase
MKRIEPDWSVGPSEGPEQEPREFVPAVVPGAVQLDWARAKSAALPEESTDLSFYDPLEDLWWTYRARVRLPKLGKNEEAWLVLKGVDYSFRVRVNGVLRCTQEGMFTPVEIPLRSGGRRKDLNLVEVIIAPAPKSHPERDNHQPDRSCKPAVSYGWDFHPRLVPLGIWDEAFVEVRPRIRIAEVSIGYELTRDLSGAKVFCEATLTNIPKSLKGYRAVWTFLDPDGRPVFRRDGAVRNRALRFDADIASVRLWWPSGHGPQDLYRSVLKLIGPDGKIRSVEESRVGFKRVRLVMHPGQWNEKETNAMPKGPSRPPFTLEINGRSIFVKGSNWVTPDIFPGRITGERLIPLLRLAAGAGFNMLRCWGGAPVQKETFFDLCDKEGILVWQEFPLACNRYEGTPEYLAVLDRESRSIIRRVARHASHALWCGGNELFNSWSGMTGQDAAIRLLNRNCFELDPEKPFLPTSPVFGVGHGWYTFRMEPGRDVFRLFRESSCTAYVEFGVGGAAAESVMERILPSTSLFPPIPDGVWKLRHALMAWDGSAGSWLNPEIVGEYFGVPRDREELFRWSRIMQSEGLKCLFEEARRQKPVCSMAMNWCFNEPWPAIANTSIVSWPAVPKPAYEAVKSSCRMVLLSGRAPKWVWSAGEEFGIELWLLNDGFAAVGSFRCTASLEQEGLSISLGGWDLPQTDANTNRSGPVIKGQLEGFVPGLFRLRLEAEGRPEWSSEYLFLLR